MQSSVKPPLSMEHISGHIRRGVEQARALNRPVLISVACEISPNASPIETFVAAKGVSATRALWARPSESFWMVGVGSATKVTLASHNPSLDVREAFRSVLDASLIEGARGRGVGPILLGGFRFDPAARKDRAWDDFPDALFTLPRFLFTWADGRQWQTMNVIANSNDNADVVTASVEKKITLLSRGRYATTEQPRSEVATETTPQEWTARVRRGLQAIKDGRLTKVVLARKKVLRADGPFSEGRILDQLRNAYPSCVLFAVDNGAACFVGASPESLVRLEERILSLSCLAGSAPRGETLEDDQRNERDLLASTKDRAEHNAVVSMLLKALDGASDGVVWNAEPTVVRLQTIQHLATSFNGRIKTGMDIFDLVRRLHPTPAVGGAPTEKALALIRCLEEDRGWYAAPIGWVDHQGEGEFCVAIRSALLRDNEATLYAGAGIVHGSDPEKEYQETEWKFQPLLKALVPSCRNT